MCEECSIAREQPEYRVFNQGCLWCGARYLQLLKLWPPPRTITDDQGNERPETKEERQAWRADVLRWWAAHGHSAPRMKELAAAEGLPLEPEGRRKRNG
jgi:hypothetical protein